MARRLRRAAGDDPLPDHDNLVRMVRRWERGTYRTSERYELLYATALGIRPDELRRADTQGNQAEHRQRSAGPHAPAVIAAIGDALHAVPTGPGRDHTELDRDVMRAWELAAVVADRAFRAASRDGSGLLVGAAKLRVANVYLSASRHAEAVAVAAAAADDLPSGRTSTPEEVATFGALLLAVHGVQVATELGDGREALRRAERTDPGRMPAVLLERRSTLLIDIARAQHMQRDTAAAGGTLIEAERVAPLEVRYSGAARDLLGGLLGNGKLSADLREMAARLGVAA